LSYQLSGISDQQRNETERRTPSGSTPIRYELDRPRPAALLMADT